MEVNKLQKLVTHLAFLDHLSLKFPEKTISELSDPDTLKEVVCGYLDIKEVEFDALMKLVSPDLAIKMKSSSGVVAREKRDE